MDFSRVEARRDGLTVSAMALGRLTLDTNRFSATVTNTNDSSQLLIVSLRTEPGQWAVTNWQDNYRFDIAPHSARRIDVPYVFRRMTTEAILRISLRASAATGREAPPSTFLDTMLTVGVGNRSASDLKQSFDSVRSEHFDVFARRGSLAAARAVSIAEDRERALQRIAELLDAPFTGRIRLVLYPDAASKFKDTGHRGEGFASGRTVIEIYNEAEQLDPYHEVAHIVGGERGSPPAMFNEGFAVYASALLGADALRYLGAPGKTVNQVSCENVRSGQLIPLRRLFHFTELGSDSTNGGVSYPESASVVQFFIERFGGARFRDLYSTLRNTESGLEQARNEERILASYGEDLARLEVAWRSWLRCSS
jgi:hypothetical protein